jgi:integrase
MAFNPEKITEIGTHHSGERGLFLVVRGSGSSASSGPPRTRSWLFIFQQGGKRREMGLGTLSAITLTQAKRLAAEQRELLARGIDPIEERKRRKAAETASDGDRVIITFEAVARAYLESRQQRWTEQHVHDWRAAMTHHVYPLLGAKAVRKITSDDVIDVLRPIWGVKHKTALKVRQQIEAVLEYGAAMKHCDENQKNPADVIKRISVLLGETKEVHQVVHHPAMPYQAVPAFMVELMQRHVTSSRALQFVLLTAVRAGDVRGARWGDIDFDTKVWKIARTKSGQPLDVPLSAAALKVLRIQHERRDLQLGDDGHVFPGARGSISTATMRKMLRMLGAEVTVHGFRASFKTWAGETTTFQREVIEAALAHAAGDAVEQAYNRGTFFAKRRELMSAWSDFCTTPPETKVIPLRA